MMKDKPWWRDARQLPPPTALDRYLGGVTPRGLIFAGVLLVLFALVTLVFPAGMPISMTAFGGALIGQGVVLRRNELRDGSGDRAGGHSD